MNISQNDSYQYTFKLKDPHNFQCINVNAQSFYHVANGHLAWLNKFINCTFTSINHAFSDSWFTSCYISGGGVVDNGAGNQYTNNHIDNTGYGTEPSRVGILFGGFPTNATVTNCYFDNHNVPICIDASNTGGGQINLTITGCVFRGGDSYIANTGTINTNMSNIVGDIHFNAPSSYTAHGVTITGCAMTGYRPSFVFSANNTISTTPVNWDNIEFVGNTNVSTDCSAYWGVNTKGNVHCTTLYYTNLSLSSSDARLKTKIQSITDQELAVAKELQWLFKTFQFKSDVNNLVGNKDIKTHVGMIAQEVQFVFEKYGLDAELYGVYSKNPMDGTLCICYNQLLCFIAHAQTLEMDRLKKRMDALEQM